MTAIVFTARQYAMLALIDSVRLCMSINQSMNQSITLNEHVTNVHA